MTAAATSAIAATPMAASTATEGPPAAAVAPFAGWAVTPTGAGAALLAAAAACVASRAPGGFFGASVASPGASGAKSASSWLGVRPSMLLVSCTHGTGRKIGKKENQNRARAGPRARVGVRGWLWLGGGARFGLNKILPPPILYGVWHTKGESVEGRILRNCHALVFQ